MSKIDIVLVLLYALAAYLGYKRGFLAELFFVVALVLGVFIGFKCMGWAVSYLQHTFHADTVFLPYIAFFIVFILVLIGVIFIGNRLKHLMDQSFLGRVDAIAGAVLSIVKFAFCASVLFWLMAKVDMALPAHWTAGSWLYPHTVNFAPAVSHIFAGLIPFFKETFRSF